MRIGVLLTIATLVLGVRSAAACDCHGAGPVCQEFWRTPVVFAGRVIAVTPVKSRKEDGPVARIQFRVTEALRGPTASSIELFSYGTNCDHAFAPGQDWIIYAFPRSDGVGLGTSICTRSQRLGSAAADLEYARRVYSQTGWVRGKVFGRVMYGDQHRSRIVPVAGVRVTLSRAGPEAIHATTDAEGRYEASVYPGTFRIAAALPPGMSLFDADPTVELLDGRGCAEADLSAEYPTSVEGRVTTAGGAPIPNLAVEILNGDGNHYPYYRGLTDSRGRYKVTALPSGRHRPAITIGWNATLQGAVPQYLFGAGAIPPPVSEPGSKRSGADIVVPTTVRVMQVTGSVVGADGRPAAGVSVAMKPDRDDWTGTWTTIQTDREGRFVFAMIAGITYRVLARSAETRPSNPRVTVFVDPVKPIAPLRLVLRE